MVVESRAEGRGFIIKIAVAALLGIVLVICVLDAISVVRERSELSATAKEAANAAAASYVIGHDVATACNAAASSVHAALSDVVPGDHFCKIDSATDTVQIKLHGNAGTILVGRIPYVRRITVVNARSSSTGAT